MQQYGQQATPLGGGYGQQMPPMGGAVPDVKWSGLSTGTNKVPVIAFIGRLVAMDYDTQSQFGLKIVEKFDQVQILESPVPWPWATIDLPIKYSEKESSGWGHHVTSAKAIGLAQNAANLDQAKAELIGKVYEMRQSTQSYGEDKEGKAMVGDVWRFVRIVPLGGAAQPHYATQAPQTAMGTPPMATATPGAAHFDTNPQPTDTAPLRAKRLLHGRTLNEFLGVALIDPIIKSDAAFMNSIFDQSFIVGIKSSGQAIQGQDGKFSVVS